MCSTNNFNKHKETEELNKELINTSEPQITHEKVSCSSLKQELEAKHQEDEDHELHYVLGYN